MRFCRCLSTKTLTRARAKYVITFTENEFCLFEFADNQELGEAAMEGKWLTPQNIRDALLKKFEVTNLKTSAKQILDIVKNDFAKEMKKAI